MLRTSYEQCSAAAVVRVALKMVIVHNAYLAWQTPFLRLHLTLVDECAGADDVK